MPASESAVRSSLRELIASLRKTLVQMSIAPDWEQRVGVAGAFDPAHDRPGLPDGVCEDGTTLA